MGRVFFFIAEALRALRRSAAPSLAAIVTVVLTTLLLGVFIPVISASSTTNQNVREQLALRVFLFPDTSTKQRKAVQTEIGSIPHVSRTEYVSRSEGLDILRGDVGKGPPGKEPRAVEVEPAAPVDHRLSRRPGQSRLDPGGDHAAGPQRRAEADQPGDREARRIAGSWLTTFAR